ncbi:protein-S-isoprenylcysteine O-methyltransferase [Capsaspora owczarzaki ATCC 30864]|uniref:Protein-S-isoprenylcysteine O-methyltransferase n=1 Tax=Capsaspora owczarzaki (strain ATCC 30864) TaxID=595528 RepID=A0A0D2WXS5_CAPO3|nr:protein-S-isoprenylcysteine O-methyltransferase [Capsaspora owczarzaki ATCC 30864]KJE98085.1 protein-S-isoprenylcysteine O-methyltransferase [Capsaspora owczarzaki ATCC 30864]|eukprot:XP_004342712.1 protein-S-isoprenylcysteine O-methyltransferase [Capsaspora owczarzaki ATCC 30864]
MLHESAIRSYFLGLVGGAGILVTLVHCEVWTWGVYMLAMSVFHFGEFYVTARFNSKVVNLDSFLLNHSNEYLIAAAVSWAEFWLEQWLFPSVKQVSGLVYLGLVLIVVGDGIRKYAMYTAGVSFNHLVQDTKKDDHTLIKHGLYGIVRHPSYMGWYLFSVGTQLLLVNPVCLVGYAVFIWKFFSERIVSEEYYLLRHFGEAYRDYQKQVPLTGVPFVQGCVPVVTRTPKQE